MMLCSDTEGCILRVICDLGCSLVEHGSTTLNLSVTWPVKSVSGKRQEESKDTH